VSTAESSIWPLGEDAALIPRTPAIAETYHTLMEKNFERLANWFPGYDKTPTLEGTRAQLRQRSEALLEGSELPFAIAVRTRSDWRLVGATTLLIDLPARSAEVGYWLDAEFEGRGLAIRAVSAILDRAFGRLGLDRVELRTNPTNSRSRSVAQRLGFTQEGTLREAALFPNERRDEVVYGLLAREWRKRGTDLPM
jgi:ribosomal-protein-serine acetyltransferase